MPSFLVPGNQIREEYTDAMRNAAMQMVIADEDELYNYKNIHELKLPDWPSHTGQWRKYKADLSRILEAWDWAGSKTSGRRLQ